MTDIIGNMATDKRVKYNWPTEVGETSTIVTKAKNMSFRILAWNYGKRSGRNWRMSARKIPSDPSDPGGTLRFEVTRVA